jgi:transmembrane sensor
MQKERLNQLLQRYHNNQLSQSEKSELMDFLQHDANSTMLDSLWNKDFESSFSEININQDILFEKIITDKRLSPFKDTRKIKRIKFYKHLAAACVIIFFLSLSGLWIYQTYYKSNENLTLSKSEVIIPGGKLARMQFEDDSFIEFEDIKQDTVLLDKGIHIKVSDKGDVSYELINKTKSIQYTTVYTPRGGEYTLTLADGSRVWLNSESKIKYPLVFNNESREVEIEGEVYFDVESKSLGNRKIPFKVKTKTQIIEVLGTEFNVNAYYDNIYTTLVEGSVAVKNITNQENIILAPNQQSEFNTANGSIEKSNVDPYYFIAWKSGKFAFKSATIQQVMADLARWYDVEVIYQGDFRNITYSGSISRLENFEEVLKLIELTNKFKFKIDGRRVTVIKA